MKKFLALLLALCMVLALCACGETAEVKPVEEADEAVAEEATEPAAEAAVSAPLVVAYDPFSAKFSPYYADTAYDVDVVEMTTLGLLTTDRAGGIVYNAIEGETIPYNGTDYLYKGPADVSVNYDEASDTTTYTAKLKEGILFSDGVEATADDIIFTYYTLLDPSYVGSTTLSSYDIVGLKEYQLQLPLDIVDKYTEMGNAIFAAQGEAVEGATQEQIDGLFAAVDAAWKNECQRIVDYCMANYASAYSEDIGLSYEELAASEGAQIAFGMAEWGFATDASDGVLTTWDKDGNEIAVPFDELTIDNYYDATYSAYEGDVEAFAGTESPDGNDVVGAAVKAFAQEFGALDEEAGADGIPNISGITKLDDYTVQVVTNGYEAPAVYSILGVYITPLHYYGDVEKYDYENNKFGFDFGDLSTQKAKIEEPLGCGPYKFVSYENKVVTFAANENYYLGCPKIAEIQFKETNSAEVATALVTGEVDCGELTGSNDRFAEVCSYNSNGELTGDVVTTSKVDNLGYGYIGINADTVNVNGEPASDASKALRKGLATVLAVYRDVAFDSYYGEAASVIQYPISNTSWAAPQSTDPDFKLAFSVDAAGNDLYTADMTADQKYEAAMAGAVSWFEAAGYTLVDGKLVAPEGAKTEFEVIIPADGIGDHPSFTVLTMARDAFESIGITLTINDPADSNELWDALDAGTQELWCAAWQATIDPDMYQTYHSSGIVGRGGSDSNHYHIDDPALDQLIVDARRSDDQSYRKSVYKQCLDTIIDWAVEIPAYQRQNCVIFSTERINIDTLTPDITTFWRWMHDIELLEMN